MRFQALEAAARCEIESFALRKQSPSWSDAENNSRVCSSSKFGRTEDLAIPGRGDGGGGEICPQGGAGMAGSIPVH